MIITIKGSSPDIFKDSNIGTLSTWTISRVLGDGATYNGVTYVDKNAALNATVTIAEGYELGTAGVTVTMGGSPVSSGVTVDGQTVTISIGSVTGNVMIKVPTKNTATGGESGGSGDNGNGNENGGSDHTGSYTLVHGNQYVASHIDNVARATISPYTIVVPKGVTITNKSTIKWAYYTNVNLNNMPSGSGNGSWGDYTYTGTGAAIGIAFKKADDSEFDWSVDSNNPADYFDVSDEGLWNGTAEGEEDVPVTPDEPEGTAGDIAALTFEFGNPYGTADQQTTPTRVHSSTNLYLPAGTTVTCKDTSIYKWALRRVAAETGSLDAGDGTYKPDSVWTTKTSYTTETNGYWMFILLKASNEAFNWSVDSNKVSDYFTVS